MRRYGLLKAKHTPSNFFKGCLPWILLDPFYLIHPLSQMFDRLLFKHMYLITGLGSSLFFLVWKVVAAFITWAVSLNLFPAVFSFFLNQFSAWSSIAFWRPCRSLLNPMYCFSIIRTSLSWFFIFDLYIEFDMAVSF